MMDENEKFPPDSLVFMLAHEAMARDLFGVSSEPYRALAERFRAQGDVGELVVQRCERSISELLAEFQGRRGSAGDGLARLIKTAPPS